MCKKFITSEFVSCGHPDKIADIIGDSLLDEYLRKDPNTRAGIEVMVKDNIVVLGGEVTSKAAIDYDHVVRNVFNLIDFPEDHNLSPSDIKIINLIGKQSSEIHQGVDKGENVIGAGDQGFVVGYASNDTDVYMPLGHYLAKNICQHIANLRHLSLGPDTKSQVTIEYDDETKVSTVKSILVSTMHQCSLEECHQRVRTAILNNTMNIDNDIFIKYIAANIKNIKIDINPCGSWHVGGPVSDCGITGRKIVVDQFGGYSNVGGGSLSAKDYTKVDRSAAYMARYLAKNIVAAGISNTAKVELSYIIGKPEPSSINIELDKNCNKIDDIKEWILKNVDLTPYGIIKRFGGDIPRNTYTQFKGFYGHNTSDDNKCKLYFPWEKLDLIDELKELCNIHIDNNRGLSDFRQQNK